MLKKTILKSLLVLGVHAYGSAPSIENNTFEYTGNPMLNKEMPGFLYLADPSVEVFNGKIYAYCSRDVEEATSYATMQDYAVLESSDLKTWINHGVVLKPRTDEGFEYAHSQMNAPDAAYKDGWYYLYFPYDKQFVGVAKSRAPVGPWETAVTNRIANLFDPTVFVDDDGQAYMYGNDRRTPFKESRKQPKLKTKDQTQAPRNSFIYGAKLKPNMIELDGPWIRLSEERVDEAVHVFKRNGKYYFHARVRGATRYWMADEPLPQFAESKGELAPNAPESPNHASAVEFKGEWYFFYHRGDVNGSGSRYRRSACFDKMTFRPDGTIEPIKYTLKQK